MKGVINLVTHDCSGKWKDATKKCPLCNEKGSYVSYELVRNIACKELQHLVEKENYYSCRNSKCEVVFYNDDEDKIFLIYDINLALNFSKELDVAFNKCGRCNRVCKTNSPGDIDGG